MDAPGTPFEDEVVIRRLRWSSEDSGFAVIDADREGDDVVLVDRSHTSRSANESASPGPGPTTSALGMQVKVPPRRAVPPSGDRR